MKSQSEHHLGLIGNAFSLAIVVCACLLPFTRPNAPYNQSAASKSVASQVIPQPATSRDVPEAGHWKLNRERSIFEPGPGPASATLAISVEPPGHHFIIRRVHRDGTVLTEDFVRPMDGKDHETSGSDPCGTFRAHKIDSLTIKVECKRDGKLLSTNIWILSNDASEMTMVKHGTTRDGRPLRNVATWERKE